jgi:hypothetical protein
VAIIVPSLALRTLMDLVSDILSYFNTTATLSALINFDWATSFIYCFTTMAVFLGVAVIAMQRLHIEVAGKNSKDNGSGNDTA